MKHDAVLPKHRPLADRFNEYRIRPRLREAVSAINGPGAPTAVALAYTMVDFVAGGDKHASVRGLRQRRFILPQELQRLPVLILGKLITAPAIIAPPDSYILIVSVVAGKYQPVRVKFV